MPEERDVPSWSQQDGITGQREFRTANARARRMRREPTPTEKRLWKALRALNREGFHFRRQPPVGPSAFDFGDLGRRLLIEVDGGVHERLAAAAERDVKKTAWAEENGFTLLRFENDQVWGDLDAVISAIRKLDRDPHPLPPPHKGEGKP
jgi:very-short-patch-repair endonuclease